VRKEEEEGGKREEGRSRIKEGWEEGGGERKKEAGIKANFGEG
jgi:hypothetical protein